MTREFDKLQFISLIKCEGKDIKFDSSLKCLHFENIFMSVCPPARSSIFLHIHASSAELQGRHLAENLLQLCCSQSSCIMSTLHSCVVENLLIMKRIYLQAGTVCLFTFIAIKKV